MPKIDAFTFRKKLRSAGLKVVEFENGEFVGPRPVMRRLNQTGLSVISGGVTASNLQSYGFEVDTVLDVGVDAGTPFLYDAFPDKKFVLFDPIEETATRVAPWRDKIDYDLHIVALDSEDGEAELVIPTTDRKRRSLATVAGFSNDYENRIVDMEKRVVEKRRLDSYTAGIPGRFGLKIDTEGNELAVIRGGLETLKRTEFVLAEVSVKRRFKDGYRFSEFVAEMGKHGFELIEALRPVDRASPDCDLLFVPWNSSWFDLD
ncbi:FkbM family methyltransferase [uncultured Ruegeria sp.]|uniref:FkbM family methyltransferase n=1 Tax=uncultured Ruegeria sp. TaxID=259304 RepID=UPI00262F2EE5|nr:FkbM family methyltransferase [uncultured Ruegeria sp.]